VAVPVTRYPESRQFLWTGLVALVLTGVSASLSSRLWFAWLAAALFFVSSLFCFCLAALPSIDIEERFLRIHKIRIAWSEIRSVDQVLSPPLIVRLTLADKSQVLVFYAGNRESRKSLLRTLQRFSREALIEGQSYREFWGETPASPERKRSAPNRYPLLLAEDEAEVERLFQLLKTVGHLDPKNSPDE